MDDPKLKRVNGRIKARKVPPSAGGKKAGKAYNNKMRLAKRKRRFAVKSPTSPHLAEFLNATVKSIKKRR